MGVGKLAGVQPSRGNACGENQIRRRHKPAMHNQSKELGEGCSQPGQQHGEGRHTKVGGRKGGKQAGKGEVNQLCVGGGKLCV